MPTLHDQLELTRAQRNEMQRKRDECDRQLATLDAQLDSLLDALNDQQHRRAR